MSDIYTVLQLTLLLHAYYLICSRKELRVGSKQEARVCLSEFVFWPCHLLCDPGIFLLLYSSFLRCAVKVWIVAIL